MSNTSTNTWTGYKAAKYVVNPALVEAGIKEVPPQMMYNYIKKGFFDTVEVNGQNLIKEESLLEWLNKYITKKQDKVTEEV